MFELVAPLAGSVDRNEFVQGLFPGVGSLPSRGAWIEMVQVDFDALPALESLPSRGAWIEILLETVYRVRYRESLPSRGAWIEMADIFFFFGLPLVAPLAGSVDRNDGVLGHVLRICRRSPRGERG